MDPSSRPPFKVWGIGLSRTGTSSLSAALWKLGWQCTHNPDAESMLVGMQTGNWPILNRYDAANDISTAVAFRQLDGSFPGSKFILTVRPAESWLRSVIDHFEHLPHQLDDKPSGHVRRLVYGEPRPTPQQFLDAYRVHLTSVAQYFASRPDDLLVIDVVTGEGWEKLCPFLGVPVPDEPFPNLNRTDGNNSGRCDEAADRPLSVSDLNLVFKEWVS